MHVSNLSNIDFAILIIIICLHEAGLELLEHCVGDSLEGRQRAAIWCEFLITLDLSAESALSTYLGTNVRSICAGHKLTQKAIQLGALNITIACGHIIKRQTVRNGLGEKYISIKEYTPSLS